MAHALRTALNRMGLPVDAAQYATDEMGMDTLEAWRDFHVDDDLIGLAKNLRSPGGTIQNADGDEVRHPGFLISVKAISNLKVMRLALKHHRNIQRTVTPPVITDEWIQHWDFLVDFREVTKRSKIELDNLPKVTMSDWAKTKERILNHFTEVYGEDGIPLAYLLRDDSEVEPEADDPHDGYNDDHISELITRAPHTGSTFRADNRTLLRLLKKICEDTPAYEYISKYKADGRQAWEDLLDVYLGPQHTQNQAAIYEAKLQQATYSGETSRFNFDKYADIHKRCHTRLDGLEDYDYKGMDEGTKIRHLLNGIKTEKLKTVVELVRGNPEFATFDSVVRRIKDTVLTLEPTKTPTRTIAAVGKDAYAGVEPDMSIEDKYYPRSEFHKLTDAQKKGLLIKRKQRGGNGKKPKGKGKDKKGGDKDLKRARKQIAKLERQIAALNVDDPNEGSDSDSEVEQRPKKKPKATGNRGHPDLNRRGPP